MLRVELLLLAVVVVVAAVTVLALLSRPFDDEALDCLRPLGVEVPGVEEEEGTEEELAPFRRPLAVKSWVFDLKCCD